MAIVPSEQLKLGLPVQVPCEGVTVPRLKPAGKVSVRLTLVAAAGPALETVIVYVCTVAAPAVTLVTPSLFAIARFAVALKVAVSV